MGDSIQWATEPGQILSDYEIMVATKMARKHKKWRQNEGQTSRQLFFRIGCKTN